MVLKIRYILVLGKFWQSMSGWAWSRGHFFSKHGGANAYNGVGTSWFPLRTRQTRTLSCSTIICILFLAVKPPLILSSGTFLSLWLRSQLDTEDSLLIHSHYSQPVRIWPIGHKNKMTHGGVTELASVLKGKKCNCSLPMFFFFKSLRYHWEINKARL